MKRLLPNPMERQDPSVIRFGYAVPRLATRMASELGRERVAMLEGEPIPARVFGMSSGMLPVFVWLAERMSTSCLEDTTANPYACFEPDEDALTGITVRFPGIPDLAATHLLFLQHAFHDVWENMPAATHDNTIALDPLVDMFHEDMLLRLRAAAAPQITESKENDHGNSQVASVHGA